MRDSWRTRRCRPADFCIEYILWIFLLPLSVSSLRCWLRLRHRSHNRSPSLVHISDFLASSVSLVRIQRQLWKGGVSIRYSGMIRYSRRFQETRDKPKGTFLELHWHLNHAYKLQWSPFRLQNLDTSSTRRDIFLNSTRTQFYFVLLFSLIIKITLSCSSSPGPVHYIFER